MLQPINAKTVSLFARVIPNFEIKDLISQVNLPQETQWMNGFMDRKSLMQDTMRLALRSAIVAN
jgi:hypothetical protein